MLAVDALEIVLLDHAPDIVVLLTGDRAFPPGAENQALWQAGIWHRRERQHQSRSPRSVQYFLYIDEILTYKEAGLQQSRVSGFHLLVRAASILERQGQVPFSSTVRLLMQQLDSTFDPASGLRLLQEFRAGGPMRRSSSTIANR